jgi:tRNA (guanosine-2'-O-)-methyltransferase
VGHRPKHNYIVRTPVEAPDLPALEEMLRQAGPPPPYVNLRRYRRFLATLAQRQPDLTVVLENVHDPFNMSAVLRTCDAVGVGTIHLLYSKEEPPPIASRVSSSAQKWMDLQMHEELAETYAVLRQEGLRICATGIAEEAIAPHEVDWTQPSAIVLGNENRGVSPQAMAQADATLFIPMRGMVQSVNITVAAAMCLHEAQRQRDLAGFYDVPRTPTQVWKDQLAQWLEREKRRGRKG